MSTRKKEVAPPAKERRGTSPSTGASAAGRRSPGASPSGRTMPSYLKPTTASSLSTGDASKAQPAKKKPSITTSDKATIERRRSFDKPPSPSRTTRSPASPGPTFRSSSFSGKISNDPGPEKASIARRRSFDKPPSPSRTTRSPASPTPTVRSSSFSGKTSTTLTKGAKDIGKQHSLHARPVNTVKKNSVVTKKNEPGKKRVAKSSEKIEKLEARNVPEPQPHSDEHETFVVEEEESGYSLLGDEDVANIIEQIEGDFLGSDAVIESPTAIEHQDDVIESPTVTEQNNDATESPTVTENEVDNIGTVEEFTDLEHEDKDKEQDKSQDEEISDEQEDAKEETTNEMNHTDDNDESGAGDPNEEDKERDVDDKHEEANDSKSNDKLEENEVQKVVVAEEKNEEAEDATPRVSHGKKDLALSNDVIEETRNKLIEQRKNKVKALAGAFETVISLQDK